MLRLYYDELSRLDYRATLAAAHRMTPLMVFLLEDLE